jgi:hypothetical protein
MLPKHQRYIDSLNENNNVTTLEYIDKDNFNFECRTCGTHFTGNVIFKSKYQYPCPTCLKKSQSKPESAPSREEYVEILSNMGYELLERGLVMSKLQLVRCTVCGHEQSIKPIQKIQAAKKYGETGGRCVKCLGSKIKNESGDLGQKYVDEITARGYEVVSEGPYNQADKINVIRKECGHKFTARLSYIWDGRSICSVCNKAAKVERLQQSHMK